MTYAPFDVVLVPFPFADRLTAKLRPAVVVSNPRLQEAAGVVWLAMITSAKASLLYGDVPVTDLEASGLRVSCMVRTAKTATLDPARIVERLGALSAADARTTMGNLRLWLAEPPEY